MFWGFLVRTLSVLIAIAWCTCSGLSQQVRPRYKAIAQLDSHYIPASVQLGPKNRVAYVSHSSTGDIVVAGRRTFGPFPVAGGFAFDPKDERIAFRAGSERRYYVVVDGHPFGPTQELPFMEFSRDGERLTYGDAQKQFLYVIDRRYRVQRYKYVASTSSDKSSRNPWAESKRSIPSLPVKNAFVVKQGSKEAVLVDGLTGPSFDQINGASGSVNDNSLENEQSWDFAFNDKGDHFAYVAKIGGRACLVKDSKPSIAECYERILRGTLQIAPDGARTTYVAGDGRKQFVVFDGKREQSFEEVGPVELSPDWSVRAYSARSGKTWMAVINAKPSGSYDAILSDFNFSPEAHRLAFIGSRGSKQFCVVDGREGPHYLDITAIMFSPDGKHFAYSATSAEGATLLLDGKTVSGPQKGVADAVFSPDSLHIAYVADDGYGRVVVVDKQPPGRRYARIVTNSLVFNTDGSSVAYVAEEKQNRMFVAVNDKAYGPYRDVDELQGLGYVSFAPGTSRAIYAVKRGASDLVMIDGRPAFNLRCVLPGRSLDQWTVYGCLTETLTKITVSADMAAAPR